MAKGLNVVKQSLKAKAGKVVKSIGHYKNAPK